MDHKQGEEHTRAMAGAGWRGDSPGPRAAGPGLCVHHRRGSGVFLVLRDVRAFLPHPPWGYKRRACHQEIGAAAPSTRL